MDGGVGHGQGVVDVGVGAGVLEGGFGVGVEGPGASGFAAEATVCAQLLQTVARGDNLTLEDQLRHWSEELRRR
ncbi:hypothetical protein [Streptomyces sp. NPDC003032]